MARENLNYDLSLQVYFNFEVTDDDIMKMSKRLGSNNKDVDSKSDPRYLVPT